MTYIEEPVPGQQYVGTSWGLRPATKEECGDAELGVYHILTVNGEDSEPLTEKQVRARLRELGIG